MPNRQSIVFLGYVLPDASLNALLKTEHGMPVQTHLFGRNILECLTSAGYRPRALSFAPVRDFPMNRRIFFGYSRFTLQGIPGLRLPFINVVGAKHLTRFASAFISLLSQTEGAVLVHGVNSSLLAAALVRRLWCPSPVVAILTDPPSLSLPSEGVFRRSLKALDRRLTRALLSKVDGVIALSPWLARDFAPGKPVLLMEGIAPSDLPALGHSQIAELEGVDLSKTAVYAGQIDRRYGVLNLALAASRYPGDWRLVVFGRGPDEGELRTLAAASERVIYPGFASPRDLASVYREAACLVNPRPVDQFFVKYSFPSKLMEYLASGSVVVTTNLPSIPEDYLPHLVISGSEPHELADTINDIVGRPERWTRDFGEKARAFVQSTRNTEAQGERIGRFLDFFA